MAKIIGWLTLRNMSIRQSFIALQCVFLAAAAIAIVGEFAWAERFQQRFADHPSGSDWVMNALIAAVLLTVGACLVLMAALFYALKLKKPLRILMSAADKISANDLEFRVSYESGDELGELCRAFEKMRRQLEDNFKQLWRSIEERNRVNAVFAHDMRTPLAVMKGYVEFIATYLPQKKISEDKLLDSIRTLESRILYMERYVEAMSSVRRLEDRAVSRRETKFDALAALLTGAARRIAGERGVALESRTAAERTTLCADPDLILEVFENMAGNAVRYAASGIMAEIAERGGVLSIAVADDGPGFAKEELEKAALPFYRGEGRDGGEGGHHGLGLYICKTLCEKHGGELKIENLEEGGAKVTASFLCRVEN